MRLLNKSSWIFRFEILLFLFVSLYRAGVVDQAIQSLNAEKAKLLTECDQAQALEKIAQESTKPLTGRQRWRIPIVFVKISHSKCLSAPDTKILRAVTQNIKCEEDALRMAAVLAPSPSKHRHGGFCSGGEASPAISAPPTAPTSRAVSFSGNHTAAAITISTTPVSTSSTHHHSQHLQQHTTPNHSPVHTTSVHTTPVHSTPSQSRLLRPTSASRLRAEGVQHHPPHYQEHISSVHSSVHTTTTPVHSTSVHAPVHSTPSHSRLLRPTSASRLRTEGVEHHPAPSCCNSRQTSFRQKESSVHSTAAEGHGNVHRTASKDEPVAAVSFYSKKKKAASKTPRAHKKNSQKSRSRAESQPILNRLRKLSFGLTGGKSPQESGEGCNAELDTSTASAASEDELSLRCHEDNEEDAMLSNTMQRVMAGLGALNNSLRASFGLSAGTGKCCSDKNAKCQQAAAAGASAASAPITEESVTIKSQTSQNAQEGVDRNAALIHVSKKPTADYSASTAAAGGTGARTSTLSRSDSNSNNEPRPIPSEKQSAAAFSMQKFFAGLVRWRSNEKVYVEEVMQE